MRRTSGKHCDAEVGAYYCLAQLTVCCFALTSHNAVSLPHSGVVNTSSPLSINRRNAVPVSLKF
jgi:hypothetical protein